MAMVLAYLGLLAWSFLAATIIPIGSEAALAALIHTQQTLWLPVLVATIGNYAGSCTTYWLGSRTIHLIERRARRSRQHTQALALLRRWGPIILLLAWVPVLGDVLVAMAGASGVRFAVFSWWVVLGKGARYLLVGMATLALVG